ncbi:hypothetical protein [Microbacterium sp. NPDC056234]|uniref:hypothetical protein n=1 Tax=Microbacterium sp. NPDC056234 TaxID=3345757 RepID=UPI0035DF4A34
MKRAKRLPAVVAMLALLAGCAAVDPRAIAEERLTNSVGVSVDAMGSVVASIADETDPMVDDYTTVATYELLSGLDDLPVEPVADTLYCLDRVDGAITACVFYPMNVNIPAGLDGFYASIYGCAELSGTPGDQDITVEDVDCPQELVDWFSERSSVEEPEAVSISDIHG